MYQFNHEIKKENRKQRIYSILFLIFSLADLIWSLFDKEFIRAFIILILAPVIFHFYKRKKVWANFLVSLIVWLGLILIVILLIASLTYLLKEMWIFLSSRPSVGLFALNDFLSSSLNHLFHSNQLLWQDIFKSHDFNLGAIFY